MKGKLYGKINVIQVNKMSADDTLVRNDIAFNYMRLYSVYSHGNNIYTSFVYYIVKRKISVVLNRDGIAN